MIICVNSREIDVHSSTLQQLIDELGYKNMRLALAMDGQFVPRRQWEDVCVQPQTKIEIVAPMQGG